MDVVRWYFAAGWQQRLDDSVSVQRRACRAERMAAVLGTLVVAVRELARAIAPIIPLSADKLLTQIDAGAGGAPIALPQPLFPRLELEEEPEAAA